MALPEKHESVDEILAAQIRELEDDEPNFYTPFEQELSQAAKIHNHARYVVGGALEDARAGRQMSLATVGDVVDDIIASIRRNPDAILALSMLKRKDDYTFMHSVNVGVLLISFCCSMGMDEEDIFAIGIGGMLFDVGKMRIPNRILNKPGPLSDQEFSLARRHVEIGRRLLECTPGIHNLSLQVAALHHERMDGSGYPAGLKGEQITKIGQMAAIVDVYDAITSTSSYRKGREPNLVLKKMLSWRGSLFDGDLVQNFIQLVGVYPVGSLVRLDNGLIGVVVRPNPVNSLYPVVNVIINANKKKFIKPYEVDLAVYKDSKEGGYKIKSFEPTSEWKVEPGKFISLPEGFL
ncbi:MAG: HD-GYP domain-containing protein [Magnetococcales bacterium]|nr:HD-GYP domain-containing protein [Magnetococcales bacterium]